MTRFALFAICVCCVALRAAGDEDAAARFVPASGSVSDRSHGWAAMPVGDEDDAVLVHIPPRDRSGAGSQAAEPLSIVRAKMLRDRPTHLVADGDSVTLVFESCKRNKQAQLYTLGVRDAGNGWSYSLGRLRAAPSAPIDGRVLSAADCAGLVVLLISPAARVHEAGEPPVPSDPPQLWLLDDDEWFSAELPDAFRSNVDAHDVGLVSKRDRIVLWSRNGSEPLRVWSGEFTSDGTNESSAPSESEDPEGSAAQTELEEDEPRSRMVEWDEFVFETRGAPADATPLAMLQGRLILTGTTDARLSIWSSGQKDVVRLWVDDAELLEEGSPDGVLGLAPLVTSQRVVVVRGDTDPQDPRLRLAEISLATGEVLAQGKAVGRSFAMEVRLLALLILFIAAVAIGVAIAPDRGGAEILPNGFALAEPSRRVFAAALDLMLAAFVAGRILGIGPFEALAITALEDPTSGHWGLIVTLAVGFAISVPCEVLFGRTFGKILTGCRVARAGEKVRKPSLFGAIARNSVKWFVPPLALVQTLWIGLRHRGETIAGTFVVVPLEQGGAEGGGMPSEDRESSVISSDSDSAPAERGSSGSSSDPPSDR